MQRRQILKAGAALGLGTRAQAAPGPFTPDWDSLASYQVPTWFRDAKFGIWAHWGPQCQPEAGDWYARHMYIQGHRQYEHHLRHWGHPSQVGFKDVIRAWKAEHWDPEELVGLYARSGARYFMALANHHDNFDNWASRHHPWNATRVGPGRDLIGGWAQAARRHGLPFGVSVHSAHAWTWMEVAQGADRQGPLAGLPYDGHPTARPPAPGPDGLDPQDLYVQRHARSSDAHDPQAIHRHWDWGHGASQPDAAYVRNFHDRVMDLIEQHRPDMVYFDDTVLPLHPISDVGLRIAAAYYNASTRWHGSNQAVINGKILNEQQRRSLVWDIERGQSNGIEPLPWQTCTCLGDWHYDRRLYTQRRYKSAHAVIAQLADVVSKNGNLLLSVPVRGDGSIDELERAVVERIGAWLRVNGPAVYGTRPWKLFGEGPSVAQAQPLKAQGFNEGGARLGAQDLRYTQRGRSVFAIVTGRPALDNPAAAELRLQALGRGKGLLDGAVQSVQVLGSALPLRWQHEDDALVVTWPPSWPTELQDQDALALEIQTA